MRAVENIGPGRHQLKADTLRDVDLFLEAQVMDVPPGTFQNVETAIAEAPARRGDERGRVKPTIGGAIVGGQVAIANAVWNATGGVGAGRIGAREGGENHSPVAKIPT